MSSEASEAAHAVVDFLGVETDERKPPADRSALHSKIKPQMMQRVLSWRGMLEKPPKMESDSGKADLNKTIGLFPQTAGFGFFPHPENFGHSHLHSRVLPYLSRSASQGGLPACPTRNSCPQLTIFYNGVVNVFDVDEGKAQAIMTLAESFNSIPQNKTPTTNTSGEETDPRKGTATQMRADLPIARKHSLQRFLQKRKDRLISKAPYDTALQSKVTKDGNKEEIAKPECAALQPPRLLPVE